MTQRTESSGPLPAGGYPDLAGKVCAITGGAGVLGRAICLGLAGAGIRTAIIDINPDAAIRAAHEIESVTGTRCLGVGGNVLDRESLMKAGEIILTELGEIDFLINGAGGNSPKATTTLENYPAENTAKMAGETAKGTFFDLDESGFKFVFDLNFMGTLLPSQVLGEAMARRGSGVILNISSMNSFRPLTKIPAYSAAKASINNFTQWLAVHLAPAGIRVNAIAPGFFLTDQNRFLLTDKETGERTARGNKILNNTPMGRYGNPEDLQGAVLFLLSGQASFITGVILPVDGGYSAYGGV